MATLRKIICKRFQLPQDKILFVQRRQGQTQWRLKEKNLSTNPCWYNQHKQNSWRCYCSCRQRKYNMCGGSFVIYGIVIKSTFPIALLKDLYMDLKVMGSTEVIEHRKSTDLKFLFFGSSHNRPELSSKWFKIFM